MSTARGFSLLELLCAVAVMLVLAGLAVIPAYHSYQSARAVGDAAQTLAQDISYMERVAQNGGAYEGATIEVVSLDPFAYDGYHGRPADLDPRSSLGALVLHRRFDGVALSSGPLDESSPLLFASNGSVQYQAHGTWPDQHQTIRLVLTTTDGSRTAPVDLELFTGAVSTP